MNNCINSASYQKQDGKKSEKEQWGYSGSFGDFLCCWWGLKRFRVLERAQGRVRGENNQNLYFSQQLSSHLIQLLLFIQKHAFITLANNYNTQVRPPPLHRHRRPRPTTILIAADPDYQVFSNIKVVSLGQIESLPAHGIHCGMSWHNHVKSHSQQTRQSQSWNRSGWQNTTVQVKGSALTL